MSYHDLEIDLGLDVDELLAEAEMRRVAAPQKAKARRTPAEPKPDCLGWYPLGRGPGRWV